MAAASIPNMNPTGVIGSGAGNTMSGQGSTPYSAFMPGTGGAGNMGFGNAANPVPSQASSANPYMATPTATMNPGNTSPVSSVPTGELSKIYGGDIGALIAQYLGSNGGYNSALTQQAVAGQTNAMTGQIQAGANNLTSMLGAMGISAGSSGLQQSLGNYMNQAATQENAITSQEYYNMWNQSQSNELSMLSQVGQNAATYEANKFNWMDILGGVVGLGEAGANIAKDIKFL